MVGDRQACRCRKRQACCLSAGLSALIGLKNNGRCGSCLFVGTLLGTCHWGMSDLYASLMPQACCATVSGTDHRQHAQSASCCQSADALSDQRKAAQQVKCSSVHHAGFGDGSGERRPHQQYYNRYIRSFVPHMLCKQPKIATVY